MSISVHNQLKKVAFLCTLLFILAMQASFGQAAYYVRSSFVGEPWGSSSNTDAMNTAFGAGEWTAEYFETMDVGTVFSPATCFVFLEGSDGNADELESFLTTNITTIEDWVSAGGHLFLNAAPNEGDGMSFGFDGTTLNYAYYTSDATAYDPAHPIFEGPFTPVGLEWTGGSFAHATVSGTDLEPLITDTYDLTRYCLAEKSWGTGDVLFGGMTTNNFHSPALEAANLRANIIAYLASCIVSTDDVGISQVSAPTTGCGLGQEAITVKVKNFGSEDQSDIAVHYSLDGGATVNEIAYGLLTAGSYTNYTFLTLGDFSGIGTHNVVAWTTLAADTVLFNDTTIKVIENIPVVATFPYIEDFESGSGGWTAGGVNSSWELGTPAGVYINTPPPPTPLSQNSWTTSLAGYYNAGEQSYVTSPCMDMSTLAIPYLEFDLYYSTPAYNDGAKLQYSTDAGATWTQLGYLGDGAENWYNGYAYSYYWLPPYNYDAWVGYGAGWVHAHHDVSFLAGQPSVKFRFVFSSYSFYTPYYDGFAFDNFKLADPFPNDVGVVAIAAPESSPSLSATETVTVSVENFGSLSQTGFPVSYQIDGGAIVTETFGETVNPGETVNHTFATTGDFSVDGDYNVVSWTALAGDEDLTNDTLHGIVSNLLPITGSAGYYVNSSAVGYEPWGSNTNIVAMNTVFGEGEWTHAYFETLDPAVVFGLGTCFVFLEGSDAHANELETFLTSNITAIQNWVASGGHLFLNAAPNEGDGMDYGFGDVHLNYSYFTSSATAVDPSHPIFNGPFTPVGTTWTGSSFAHATVSGTDIIPLITDTYDATRWSLVEKYWGAGDVLFGGMTTNNFHSPLLEAANLRANIIDYLHACVISDNDMAMSSLISPTSSCGLGVEDVHVKVRNNGFLDQTDIPVNYQLDGGSIVTEIIPGPIASGEILDYTFASTIDLSLPGTYTLAVWTALATDTISDNDTIIRTIESIPTVSTYPYYEPFESGSGGWTSGGANSDWELGTPAGVYINTPPPATPLSQNSWTTDLDDVYNAGEKSYVISPCFDFTSLVQPFIELDVNYNSSEYNDGAKMQYTLDAGSTWQDVGYIGDGENWYNSYAYSLYPMSYYYDAWTGPGSGWLHAQHDLSFLAGQPSVRFRIIFSSYDFSFPYLDGFAFDNINIQDPYQNDIGVVSLVTPTSALVMDPAETVTVNVKNFGLLSQSGFPVAYNVDGGTTHTETFVGTINPGEILPFTFAATEDFSADGIHAVNAWTELASDEDLTNDTLHKNVVNLTPVIGTGAYYLYASAVGYEPGYLLSNSTAMNSVFGDGGWTLDYYESLDPYTIFSENTCFIFMEGSESHANDMENFLGNNRDLVENWVASGGNLFINSSPYEGDGADLGFGGVTLSYPYYTYQCTATDPLHPVLSGPYTPITGDYYGYYVGYAIVSGGDISPIINDYYNASAYLLAEKSWGDGAVMFGSMSAPEYVSPYTEGLNLRTNIIDYLKLCAPIDAGVTALLSPEEGCGLTNAEEICVTVENFGPSDISYFPIKYTLDGGTISELSVDLDIPSGGSGTYCFTATGDFSVPGDHTLLVWTDISGDADETNDTLSLVVTSLATPIIDLGPNMTVCDSVILNALNPGSTYLWSTGATTQTIVVDTSGIYSVTITNPTSGCVVTDDVNVTVNYSPVASFTYTTAGLVSTFTNTSIGGPSSTYAWSFGDGATSSSKDPVHTYGAEGNYTVTLTVTNGCGSAYISQVIQIVTGIEDVLSNATNIYPNPTSGLSIISVNYTSSYDTRFELINELGQTVWSSAPGVITQGQYPIDMSSYSDGVYQLKVTAGSYIYNKQIVLTK